MLKMCAASCSARACRRSSSSSQPGLQPSATRIAGDDVPRNASPTHRSGPVGAAVDTGCMALMTEFGEYLRRRRAELQPGDVGLPDTAFRRVAGLRREEVAQLAGVSTDYYTRLEQGRDLKPSDGVLDALARALELDAAGRAHLQHLAHPARPARRQTRTVQRVRPTVQSMLDAWNGQPAFVLGRRGDVLATNALARALLADFDAMPYRDRNLTHGCCSTLRPASCTSTGPRSPLRWSPSSASTPALTPTTRAPPSWSGNSLSSVLSSPAGGPEHQGLDRTWGHKRFRHPVVGPLEIDYEALHLPWRPRPDALRLPGTRR